MMQYFDRDGRRRREKAGIKGDAIDLYRKRKTQSLQGQKLPEKLRTRVVRFSELAADALKYSKANNLGHQFDAYRIGRLVEEFGDRSAEVSIEDIREWFARQEWSDGTWNRYKSTLSLLFRLGMENGKAVANPARLLKRKREDNGRVRFLGQFLPAATIVDYLKPYPDEESRLRAVICQRFPGHQPEFEIALNTGMRPSEQYRLEWEHVDLAHRVITLPRTKSGGRRHIPMNTTVFTAFRALFERSSGQGRVFIAADGQPLKGYKHWFDLAVREAGLRDFTWYCLRHDFASKLVMKGVDLRTVSELMGHKTIQMTMRYAHLAPAHTLAAVERLVAPSHDVLTANQGSSSATPTATAQLGDTQIAGEAVQ
jgi:integrase